MRALVPWAGALLVLAQASPARAQDSPLLDSPLLDSPLLDSPLLDSLLRACPTFRDSVLPELARFELQVLYRPLDGPDGGRTYGYGVDPDRYFYPASTVKLPVAALALEKLEQLGVLGLDADTRMEVDSVRAPQSGSRLRIGTDEFATVGGHVRDIAVVSSNEAYNRLYEWLGPRHINDALHRRGYRTRIVHRLGAPGFDTTENRYLPPVTFRDDGGGVLYHRGAAYAKTRHDVRRDAEVKGRGYYSDPEDRVIGEPFDMSHKNALALGDLADVLQAVVAPETVPPARRFDLRPSDHEMLVRALRTTPPESDNPGHRGEAPAYVKFLYYGGDGPLDAGGPVIYNKVGDAYGTLTDAAVFEDAATGRRCVIAATVLVNRNGVFNDGVYEYEAVGLPLLRELGRAVWRYHLGR